MTAVVDAWNCKETNNDAAVRRTKSCLLLSENK